MPQLDKVTFLSQFFWFCIVFFSMYLILVKLFLPALARIVKVRHSLGGSADESTIEGTSKATSVYSNSLQASVTAFQAHSNFLSRWSSSQLNTIVPQISPNFNNALVEIRTESLVAETLLHEVVPPVGRQQNLVFSDLDHSQWYTSTLWNRFFENN
jgi:hypothetical protein